jgi:hypothetical protein
MLEDKRKFERFDFSVVTKIGRTGKSPQHSLGLTKNFSQEGLSIETQDFDFIPNDNLKLELSPPKGGSKIPLMGNVVWKRQIENLNVAGIKFIFQNKKSQNKTMEELSSFSNILKERVLKSAKTRSEIKDEIEEKSAAVLSAEKKDIPSELPPKSGFLKEYLESGECKVTFRLPQEVAQDAQNVTLVGDFNDWNTTTTPMTRLKDGSFEITLTLTPVRAYKFRYLIDGHRWENDSYADNYIANDYGWHDSVVMV